MKPYEKMARLLEWAIVTPVTGEELKKYEGTLIEGYGMWRLEIRDKSKEDYFGWIDLTQQAKSFKVFVNNWWNLPEWTISGYKERLTKIIMEDTGWSREQIALDNDSLLEAISKGITEKDLFFKVWQKDAGHYFAI